ncbi:MAG: exo-alpha-sialidase [Pirellulales bacterium]|nr:exo-alpha-sialidase [Pirellulales bacterium]
MTIARVLGLLTIFGFVLAAVPKPAPADDTPAPAGNTYIARDHSRKQIYHSPQTPGYTCWVGAWAMPDESLMICFTQATGPLEGRPTMPAELKARWNWPPAGQPNFDFTGLDLHNVYMRSSDEGKTWQQTGAELFHTPGGQMSQGGPQIALPDGAILRAAFGYHLPLDPDVPKTGFLQRSTDGGQTWGDRQVVLDADECTYRITRLRRLRDGRMIALGGIASAESSSVTQEELSAMWRPLFMVSEDEGKSWSPPLEIAGEDERGTWGGEEWDVAELDNGDLLAVFRRFDPKDRTKQARWQGILQKQDDSWSVERLTRSVLPHSGHPELLATREGPVLHIATNGTHWTKDGGETWNELKIQGVQSTFGSHYYPHSLQIADGTIYVFAHTGSHDPYGKDQRVMMDKFRLTEP